MQLQIKQSVARLLLAPAYAVAGVFHLTKPDVFLLITPDWVPYARQVILATGFCELAGSIALFIPKLRRAAAIGLALYAVCVFPANIKHALYGIPNAHLQLNWWYHAPRLALQPVLVWWALFAGGWVRWPWSTHPRT